MGTRADFYIRKEGQMKWLGSQGWDGHPESIAGTVLSATTENEFEAAVVDYASKRNDWTSPQNGWPWPWSDSRTTDYSYVFEDGKVMASCFGYKLFDPLEVQDESDEDEDDTKLENYFPDMKALQNIAYDNRSGALFISISNP